MLETIAVGTDGSATATKAVEFALDLAEHYNAASCSSAPTVR